MVKRASGKVAPAQDWGNPVAINRTPGIGRKAVARTPSRTAVGPVPRVLSQPGKTGWQINHRKV